jgi:tetratricopeptide (TPR) repeat protein
MAKQKPNKSQNTPIPTVSSPKKQAVSEAKNSSSSSAFLDGWLPIVAILVITFFAFIQTFQSDFVNWDDDMNILDNKNLNGFTLENIIKIFTSNIMGGYNPLPIFTFAIEKAIVGKDSLSTIIHTDNLILHLVNVFLVYRLVGLMGLSRWSALVVALLFGIHPMRVESVAWATERKDVLFGAFYFASLIQYAKYLKSDAYTLTNRHFIWAFVLFIFALFAKVQAVSLPLSMLAMDYYFKRPLNFKLVLEKTHFFLGSLAMGLGTILLLKAEKTIDDTLLHYSFLEKIMVGFYTYMVYLGKFIYPWAMSPLYPFPKEITGIFYVTPLFFIASAVGVWYAYRQGWTKLVFGWAFFIVNYIFVSQIVQAGQGYLADRFTYIPYFGFFVILAAFTEGALFKKEEAQDSSTVSGGMKLGIVAYAAILFFTTYNQVKIWKDGETLWTHTIEFDDKIPTAYQNRALIYRDRKNYEKAIADLNMSLAVKPSAASYNSRGKTYFDMNKPLEGLSDYNNAILLDSTLVEAYANRGAAFGQLGKLDSCMLDLSKALSFDSLHINALVNRGAALGVIGKKEEAIRDLSKVIELDPTHTNAIVNRSLTYREMGRNDLALKDCDLYLAIKKDNPNVWIDRALLKKQMNRVPEAIADFDEAIKLNSFNGAYYVERAQCYRLLGNRAQMQADVQTAKARGIQNIDPLLLQ